MHDARDAEDSRLLHAGDYTLLVESYYGVILDRCRARVRRRRTRSASRPTWRSGSSPSSSAGAAIARAEGTHRHGISFVFNRNRINVATSRAQCRVELVRSPRLLEADCKTPEQMALVNALCRFVELATP